MKPALFAALLAMGHLPAFSQSFLTEFDTQRLMRQNIKAKKIEILTVAMHLSEDEARKFWPLHREYENEVLKLNDKSFALLSSYTAKVSNITDAEAASITTQGLALDKQRLALREKYFRRFAKVLSPRIASRFVQLDSLMYSVVAIQITTSASLIE